MSSEKGLACLNALVGVSATVPDNSSSQQPDSDAEELVLPRPLPSSHAGSDSEISSQESEDHTAEDNAWQEDAIMGEPKKSFSEKKYDSDTEGQPLINERAVELHQSIKSFPVSNNGVKTMNVSTASSRQHPVPHKFLYGLNEFATFFKGLTYEEAFKNDLNYLGLFSCQARLSLLWESRVTAEFSQKCEKFQVQLRKLKRDKLKNRHPDKTHAENAEEHYKSVSNKIETSLKEIEEVIFNAQSLDDEAYEEYRTQQIELLKLDELLLDQAITQLQLGVIRRNNDTMMHQIVEIKHNQQILFQNTQVLFQMIFGLADKLGVQGSVGVLEKPVVDTLPPAKAPEIQISEDLQVSDMMPSSVSEESQKEQAVSSRASLRHRLAIIKQKRALLERQLAEMDSDADSGSIHSNDALILPEENKANAVSHSVANNSRSMFGDIQINVQARGVGIKERDNFIPAAKSLEKSSSAPVLG